MVSWEMNTPHEGNYLQVQENDNDDIILTPLDCFNTNRVKEKK